MNYFKHLAQIPYVAGNTSFTITDITQRVRIAERLRQYTSAMHDYVVADGSRPDLVAEQVYGDVKYTWILLLTNNILSLYDWPLTTEEFTAYITGVYGSEAAAMAATPFYYTIEGDRVDAVTYAALSAVRQGSVVTPLEHEIQLNDAKRRIKIVDSSFLGSIEQTMKSLYL